ILIFFFQAEDGIRYRNVTGVQTCALPIFPFPVPCEYRHHLSNFLMEILYALHPILQNLYMKKDYMLKYHQKPYHTYLNKYFLLRSEERRVGKECRAQCRTY